MIIYNPKSWISLIFNLHKTDTFRKLLPAMLVVAVFTALIDFVVLEWEWLSFKGTILFHSLTGFVISLLLVFRTNTAYERWWEGRKLWGSLVNTCRNMAIKLNAYIPYDQIEKREKIADLIVNYPLTLKEHLRGNKVPLVAPRDTHQPNYIAAVLFSEIHDMYKNGSISGDELWVINHKLQSLTDICGACERIRNTPIPFSYSLFIKKFIFIYTLTMPFFLIKDLGYISILLVTLVFYVLTSIEILAEEIENPFGTDPNDLPLDNLTRTIYVSSREIMGLETKKDPFEIMKIPN